MKANPGSDHQRRFYEKSLVHDQTTTENKMTINNSNKSEPNTREFGSTRRGRKAVKSETEASVRPRRRPAKLLALVGVASVLAVTLAACGGSSDSAQTMEGMPNSDQRSRGMAGSGEVVQVSGSTAQVRNAQSGQAAVTWNTKTEFTKEASGTSSDLKAGKCVVVSMSENSDDMAQTVRLTDKVNGTCMGGGGFGVPGGGPDGNSSDRPEPPSGRRPSDAPSGGPQGGMRNMTMGEIKSVASGSMVVAAIEMNPPSEGSQSNTQQTPSTSDKTINYTSSTTITKTVSAKAADVTVGKCVVTQGDSDSTGKITASSIRISSKTNGECVMGGFRGARPGGSSNSNSSYQEGAVQGSGSESA